MLPPAKFLLWTSVVGLAAFGLCAAAATNDPATASPPRPALSAPSANPLTTLFDDPVLARGKGVEVRRSELDDAFIAFRANSAMRGQTVPENLRTLREAQLLQRLLLNKIVNNRATPADQTRGKEIGIRSMTEAKKEFTSDEVFQRRLRALGLTEAQFNQRVQEQALTEAVLERELKSKIIITDEAVRDFYDHGNDVLVRTLEETVQKMSRDPKTTLAQLTEAKQKIEEVRKTNLAKLEQPERVRVLHIFMTIRNRETEDEIPENARKAKRQKMEELLKRARAGEDFAKLVVENSEDINLKETKGEYVMGRSDPFVPEFKAAAFSLQTNQISDVVVTPFGFHLVKLLEKIPAKKVEFDKTAPDIKDFLRSQELQKQLPEYFDRIKKEAGVQILEAKYIIDLPKEGEASPAGP